MAGRALLGYATPTPKLLARWVPVDLGAQRV